MDIEAISLVFRKRPYGKNSPFGLHDGICLTDFLVLMQSHCGNFKAMRYDIMSQKISVE